MLFPILPQALVQYGVCKSPSIQTCRLTKRVWEDGEIWEVKNLTKSVRSMVCGRNPPPGEAVSSARTGPVLSREEALHKCKNLSSPYLILKPTYHINLKIN